MLPDFKPLAFRKLVGGKYHFAKKGDVLPMHTHGESDVHISVCVGSFRVRGHGWEQDFVSGSVIPWQPGQYHEFEALIDDCYLINIIDA